jgi:hypothetical protein
MFCCRTPQPPDACHIITVPPALLAIADHQDEARRIAANIAKLPVSQKTS